MVDFTIVNAISRVEGKAVTSVQALKYFDTPKPTEGSGDASSKGIGFVPTQEDHPVTSASRAITQAGQRYSQKRKNSLLLTSVWPGT